MARSTTTSEKRWTLITMILTSGVVFLSGSVVNVALPKIANALKTRLSGLQWIVDGYLLTLSSLLILGGALGDRFGRRRMCMVGLVGFGLTSLGSGLSPSTGWLIALRALQGISGALMIPESLALIRVVYRDPEARGRAIGAWSGWTGIAAVIGPLLGGFLVDALSWRWAFFIILPMIVLTIYLMARFVPESRGEDRGANLDWLGAGLVTLGLGGITFGLIEGPVLGWTAPSVLSGLIAGLLALIAFPIVEARKANPLLPLSLFESRNFSGANLTTLAVYAALQGSNFLLVLYIQNVMGFSALQAGLMTAPISLILLMLSAFFGRKASRHGPRLFMTFGPITAGGGLALLARLNPNSNIWVELVPAVMVFGLGLAATVAPLTNTVMSDAPSKHSGVAAAFNNMVSRVAALLAVAGFGAILSLGFSNALSEMLQMNNISPEINAQLQEIAEEPAAGVSGKGLSKKAVNHYQYAFTEGFRQAMITGAGLAVLGGAVAFITIRNPEIKEEGAPTDQDRQE